MNNLQYKFLSIFCLLFLSLNSYGQNITINGNIQDAETSEPLIGATVLVKGTSTGTTSDFDGNFTISVTDPNDILEISYTGYDTQYFPLNGQTQINAKMGAATEILDQVVVIGYGSQKKREVTGATAQVSAEAISSTPTLRVEQALQGRTAGVQVTNLSGQPGEEPTVRVRGVGTTRNATPLYVVDGLPVGGIDYLNPGDIESIDVLKDAATAAIYGARAANGVILVTTKSGKAGKLSMSYSTYYGIQNVAKKMDMMDADEYRMYTNEGAINAGFSAPFDLEEISPVDTDWQAALFQKNAPMFNHQLSFTGGNEKSTFASTLSYFSQEGIIGGSKSQFDRYTARLNSNHKVNSFISFGNNLAYTHLIRRGIGSNQSFNGAFSSALNLDPLTPVYETDEDKLATYPYTNEPVVTDVDNNIYGVSEYVGAEIVNPLALLETGNLETRKDQLVGNVFGVLEPIKNLKFKTSVGVDLAYVLDDSYRQLFYLNDAQNNTENTSVDKKIDRYFTWQWENTLSYEKSFGSHKLTGLIGTTATEFNFENLSGFNAGVPLTDPEHVYLNQATDTLWTAGGEARHSALFSIFGRVNYNFNDKYSVSVVLRRDGSSKFGANNRYGIFPSLGAAWVVSEEVFMPDLPFLDLLKLRASWGINGNQEIGDYQFVSIIDQTRGYTFGGGREVGSSPLAIENQDIRWEEAIQLNFGIDAGFFNNRLQLALDLYNKTTEGLLEKIPIPGHVGNDGPVANVGSVENKGIEMALSWRNKKGKWKYDVGINGAYNKNEMTFIGNAEKVITGAGWAIAGAVTRAEEGLPIAYFWGFKTDGIFQNQNEVFSHINNSGDLLQEKAVPGDVRFVDVNGDGVINEEDRTNIGNPFPDFTFGVNGSVEFMNFDLSVFLQGTYGNEIFNGMQRQDLRFTNRPISALDRWTGEGTSNETPRYTWIDSNNNYRISDLYIEDGSHIRVKNIQLGYNFPMDFLEKFRASVWRVYVSAENLFTFTRYTGVDPEIGALRNDDIDALNSFDIGIDRAIYPQARTFRVGTTLTF